MSQQPKESDQNISNYLAESTLRIQDLHEAEKVAITHFHFYFKEWKKNLTNPVYSFS